MYATFVTLQCPYCFEFSEVAIDPDLQGHMVFDCEVCCRPWAVFITWKDGQPSVQVDRAQ